MSNVIENPIKHLESLIDSFIAKLRFSKTDSEQEIELRIALRDAKSQLRCERDILETYGEKNG